MEFFKAPEPITELVTKIANAHHRHLGGHAIAVVMQDKATTSRGKLIAATASRPPKRLEPLLSEPASFLICIAMDQWQGLTEVQREALIDHELCHCEVDEDGTPQLRAHDYEEFAEIVERHGFWRPDHAVRELQQALFGFLEDVTVETIKEAE